ncbi:hypothetical protein [Lactobacillus delbrueckii]|uniref:hypothetical protein n=1 Tax=Lactobacillus delbrueckii TaxID=1584 RepID=UPI0022EBBA2C|nr:hypothetical protein [Lactobacillus delbrueckii]MDA3796489.1 hypothetical protein [Lactobacillus delbrueckii]
MQLLDAEVAGIAAAVDLVFAVVVIPDVLEKVFSIFAACQALVVQVGYLLIVDVDLRC